MIVSSGVIVIVYAIVVVIVVSGSSDDDDCSPIPQGSEDEEEENAREKQKSDGRSRVEELSVLNAEIPHATQDHRHQRKDESGEIQLLDNDVIADPDSDSTHATVDSVPDAASIPDSVSGARNKAVDDRVVRDVVMAEGEMIREELPVEDEANPVQSSQFFSEKRRFKIPDSIGRFDPHFSDDVVNKLDSNRHVTITGRVR